MNKKLLCVVFFIFFIFSISDNISAQFTIDAQYRPRFEYRDGYKKLKSEGSVPSFIITQRTRVSFAYETDKLKFKFTPQDVRLWGDEQLSSSTGVYGDYAALDVYEAFAEIQICKALKISVGRQPLVYDSQRILAARNWNQNGIVYDAVVLKAKLKDWNIHAGSSWNSQSESLEDNLYLPKRIKSLSFFWLNRKFNDRLKCSFLHTSSGVTETDSTNRLLFKQTSGIYTEYKSKFLNFKGNCFYQFGKNTARNTVSAFLADADLFLKAGKETTGIGISYLSGNKNIDGNTDNLFDVLYGARHRFFGHMDYFSNFSQNTNEAGLADYYGYVKFQPNEKIDLSLTVHYFQKAQTNEIAQGSKNLGYENELAFNYKFSSWGSIKSEYMFFLPTESLKAIQEVPEEGFSQFFFLELTLTPEIYKTKTELTNID